MNIVEVAYNWPAEVFSQRHIEALRASEIPVQVVARHAKTTNTGIASVGEESTAIPVRVMPNFDHISSTA